MECSLTTLRRGLPAGAALVALLLPAALGTPVSGAVSAAAHVSSKAPACEAGTSYYASVAGTAIAFVTFALDGRRVARLHNPNSHGAFATRIGLTPGRAHRLTMTVRFTLASQSGPARFQRTLARCAAKTKEYSPAPETPHEAPLPFTG